MRDPMLRVCIRLFGEGTYRIGVYDMPYVTKTRFLLRLDYFLPELFATKETEDMFLLMLYEAIKSRAFKDRVLDYIRERYDQYYGDKIRAERMGIRDNDACNTLWDPDVFRMDWTVCVVIDSSRERGYDAILFYNTGFTKVVP
jgi:hypothetical protein